MIAALSNPTAPPRRAREKICNECGAPFSPMTQRGDFCGQSCRKAWNNRRMIRGAELYDLVMAMRHERALATRLKVWRLICRMASQFRDEDVADRAGRKSWRSPKTIAERHLHLVSTVVFRGRR